MADADPPDDDRPADARILDLLRRSPVAYGLFDGQERLRDASPAFLACLDTRLEGQPSWESILRSCHRRRRGVLIDTDDIDAWIARVRRTFRQVPLRQFESDLVDGRWMWVVETLLDEGWLLIQMTDVTPLKSNELTLRRAHDEALAASVTDALTQLSNRRHLLERLSELLRGARRTGRPLSLAVIDLDHFKRINDRYGHAGGDAVLLHLAALLRRELRPLDLAGRLGGEEFIIVLPDIRLDGALQVVDRLRRIAAGSLPVPQQHPGLRYTFSAGVAEWMGHDTPERLIRRADVALYVAKAQGRDRVVPGGADTQPLPLAV